jgi:hypothetical protein
MAKEKRSLERKLCMGKFSCVHNYRKQCSDQDSIGPVSPDSVSGSGRPKNL